MMGGQDELVFDGDSIIVDAEGGLITRGPQFEETLLVADLDLPPARQLPAGGPAPDAPAEPSDGTVMSIHRVVFRAAAGPYPRSRSPRFRNPPSARGLPRGPRSTPRWSPGSATT